MDNFYYHYDYYIIFKLQTEPLDFVLYIFLSLFALNIIFYIKFNKDYSSILLVMFFISLIIISILGTMYEVLNEVGDNRDSCLSGAITFYIKLMDLILKIIAKIKNEKYN